MNPRMVNVLDGYMLKIGKQSLSAIEATDVLDKTVILKEQSIKGTICGKNCVKVKYLMLIK